MPLRRRFPAALLLAFVLLASGCQARLLVAVDADRDGAGTVRLTLAVDRALRDEAAAAGIDPLGDLAALAERLGQGWRATDVEHTDGGREVTLSATFADPEAFDDLMARLAGALDAPEARLLEELQLDVADDRLRVRGAVALQPTDAVADWGLEPAEAVALLEEHEALIYEVTVALAGTVLETSAEDPEAVPLRWRVRPGERVEILAVAERPTSPALVLGVSGAAGGLLVVAAAGLSFRRRRRARRRAALNRRRRSPARP